MSPKKIVKRAKEIGLNLISITDHNSIDNSIVTKNLAEKNGIHYLFGMEVQTIEEVHVLTYFDNFEDLYKVWKIVYERLPDVKNNPEIFGDQVIVDEEENIIRFEEKLLINSTNLSFKELYRIVKENSGLFIPAHIDSESYSVISQLGFIPEDLDIKFVEISYLVDKGSFLLVHPDYSKYKFVSFSDSHYITDIGRSFTIFDIDFPSVSNLLSYKNEDDQKIFIIRR